MFRLIGRHFKEAFQGLFRHFDSVIASAMAVMFTLALVSLLTLIIGNVGQITKSLESDIGMFCRIDESVEEELIPALQRQVENVPGVAAVTYSDKDSELDKMISSYKEGYLFEAYRNDNPLSRVFLVQVKSGYSLSEVSEKITKIEGMNGAEFGGQTTEDFLKMLDGIRKGGYIIIMVLTLISIFLISNTIRTTIYNRNKEISIMRQVGASNSYIRQPFLIEGVFIGLIGAIIPVVLTIFGYKYVYEALDGQLVSAMLGLLPVYPFGYMVAGFLVIVAIVVGFIGSLLSVNKYLRWRR
ncbi:MAG: permease-like cell division protein FtsX [Erysipelotrichaceae bacterium]|nr:permease-like cell division protein FtsX [Erysipelotrichaceae bacterium]